MYQCPQNFSRCGEYVSVDFGTFSDTTVTVEACNQMKFWGMESYTVKKSEAANFVHKDSEVMRHKEGFVTFYG